MVSLVSGRGCGGKLRGLGRGGIESRVVSSVGKSWGARKGGADIGGLNGKGISGEGIVARGCRALALYLRRAKGPLERCSSTIPTEGDPPEELRSDGDRELQGVSATG